MQGKHRQHRTLLAPRAESRRLQALVQGSTILEDRAYRGAARYLGGRALEEALATLARLHSEGFNTGVDYLGEQRTDPAAVEAATEEAPKPPSGSVGELRARNRGARLEIDHETLMKGTGERMDLAACVDAVYDACS